MSPRDLVYVGHMLDMATKAVAKIDGLPRAAFDQDENLRLALTHLVQVIGEAARQVSREFVAEHPEVPWTDIIGMRHKVVHGRLISEATRQPALAYSLDSSGVSCPLTVHRRVGEQRSSSIPPIDVQEDQNAAAVDCPD